MRNRSLGCLLTRPASGSSAGTAQDADVGSGRLRLWLVAAEWVIGDDRRDIHVGEALARDARPAGKQDGDLEPLLARILEDNTACTRIYVWHADDPTPPVTILGTVVRIWSLPRDRSDIDPLANLGQVSVATTEWDVELYVFEVDGEVQPRERSRKLRHR